MIGAETRTVEGLTDAVSVPVFWPPGELRGVAAIGLSMDELVTNIAPLRQGQWHYAFVIDGRSMTLHHPHLPSRLRTSGDRPLLDIADLERAKAAKRVKFDEEGRQWRYHFFRELVTNCGDPRHDGILTSLVMTRCVRLVMLRDLMKMTKYQRSSLGLLLWNTTARRSLAASSQWNEEGATQEKIYFKLSLPCTSYLVGMPCDGDDFTKLLGSGD